MREKFSFPARVPHINSCAIAVIGHKDKNLKRGDNMCAHGTWFSAQNIKIFWGILLARPILRLRIDTSSKWFRHILRNYQRDRFVNLKANIHTDLFFYLLIMKVYIISRQKFSILFNPVTNKCIKLAPSSWREGFIRMIGVTVSCFPWMQTKYVIRPQTFERRIRKIFWSWTMWYFSLTVW